MTKLQRLAISHVFQTFGNGGSRYTKGNHEFLSRVLAGEKDAGHYQPTVECVEMVEAVLRSDWSKLQPRVQRIVLAAEAEENRMREVAGLEDAG